MSARLLSPRASFPRTARLRRHNARLLELLYLACALLFGALLAATTLAAAAAPPRAPRAAVAVEFKTK